MNKTTATILGFAAAPIIPSVYSALTTHITENFNLFAQLSLIIIVYGYALWFTIIFGVPTFLLARHFKLIRWWSALIAGIAIGAIVVVLVYFRGKPDVHAFMITCPLGGATGFTFWLIWKQGRERHPSTNNNDEVRQGN